MHTRGAAHLGNTADALFHLFGGDHHQISQLVDHHNDLGKLRLARQLTVLVISFDLAHARFRKETIALEHLHDRPLESAGSLFGLGHDRREHMRDAAVNTKFDHLRVDHDKFNLVRPGLVQETEDQRVHADRFAGTGGSRNQHVRQLCDIAHDALAAYILADGKGQTRFCRLKAGRLQNGAQIDRADDLVRHLNADC